jgi:hypothetical protein
MADLDQEYRYIRKCNLLVASLYAEAIKAVKSRAALSVSTSELISILRDINSEARFWNRFKSVDFNRFRKIPNFDMIQLVQYYW